ncbi:delta-like protein [Elysia marginata]|uniref:Delta-like protein n=1 Tax=Elysia marginata TaxID=1093978 RepID=A0AAV4JWX2_9GAST|nr:delta-like protein [Elysia marginata]
MQDRQIALVGEVHDHDRWTRDDDMHTWGVNLEETVWSSKAEAVWAMRSMSQRGNDNPNLTFQIRLYCDPNYYSYRCNVFCKAQDSASGHYTCDKSTGKKVCLPGWEGDNCDKDIDECSYTYDLCNTGTCENSPQGYTCNCPDGYSGEHCENLENPCNRNPCVHGDCYARHESLQYTCVCDLDWQGTHCDERRDPCHSSPCMNGGDCSSNDLKTDFTCSCSYPYTGSLCQDSLTTTLPTTTTTTTTAPTTITTTTTTTPTTITTTSPTTIAPSTSVSPSSTTVSTSTEDAQTETSYHLTSESWGSSSATKYTSENEKTSTSAQGIVGGIETARHKASDDNGFGKWKIGLIIGLATLALVAILLFFVFRRRRRETKSMSRSSSELPPLPVNSSDTDADLDQGAVGGCKTSGSGGCEDGNTQKKIPETFLRLQAGRAPPNDYADIRTLSRTLSSGRITEHNDNQENERRDYEYTGRPDDGDFNEEPQYSTLDEVTGPSLIATLPAVSTITAVEAEYAVPRTPQAVVEPSEYAVPRDRNVSPDYQTPRDVEKARPTDNTCGSSSEPPVTTPTVLIAGAGTKFYHSSYV